MVSANRCLHCTEPRPIWRRGLCWGCYRDRAVRALYPMLNTFARRGLGFDEATRMPTFPTDARPGTAEKIEVMRQRMELGQSLYHPLDARAPVVR